MGNKTSRTRPTRNNNNKKQSPGFQRVRPAIGCKKKATVNARNRDSLTVKKRDWALPVAERAKQKEKGRLIFSAWWRT
jgi:hypothetical protein